MLLTGCIEPKKDEAGPDILKGKVFFAFETKQSGAIVYSHLEFTDLGAASISRGVIESGATHATSRVRSGDYFVRGSTYYLNVSDATCDEDIVNFSFTIESLEDGTLRVNQNGKALTFYDHASFGFLDTMGLTGVPGASYSEGNDSSCTDSRLAATDASILTLH